jgi:hypothetical protein
MLTPGFWISPPHKRLNTGVLGGIKLREMIGQIAQEAHVKRLVLSHRMLRTLGKEAQSEAEIRKNYSGPVAFANDLDRFPVP